MPFFMRTASDAYPLLELQRNLMASEMRRVVRALTMAQAVTWDYAPAQIDLIRQWERHGARKGDAACQVHYFQKRGFDPVS